MPNTRIRELWGVAKDVDDRIDVSVLRWFSHIEKMENDKIVEKSICGKVWVLA